MTTHLPVKRLLDVTASTVGLTLLSPVLACAAVAVVRSSPGPVFFRQERVGLHGQTFRIHKFRTMRMDHGGPNVSAAGDPRITPAGAFLRRTKIDELPQLIDVLRGRMSLVGPRPEVPEFVAQWDPALRDLILSVRPGITDPASIVYRNEADELAAAADPTRHYVEVILPRKTALYAEYVRTRSVHGDARIIAQTLLTVAKG